VYVSKEGDYGRSVGGGERLYTPTSAVYVDGSAVGRTTDNIISTMKPAQQEACLSGNGVAPAEAWDLASHWTGCEKDVNTRLPYLPARM